MKRVRRFLGKLLLTSGVAAAAAPIHEGQAFAIALQKMPPLDATRALATAATDATPKVRLAVAEALAWPFTVVGDALALEHLAADDDPDVRIAAARAAHARLATGGLAVLERLSRDADPRVREAAIVSLRGG